VQYSGRVRSNLISIQDNDGSALSATFVKTINATDAFKVYMISTSEAPDTYIKSNHLTGMLVIPHGFSEMVQQNLARGNTRAIPRVQPSAVNATNIPRGAITSVEQQATSVQAP
jgi:hypothetical protein